MKQKFRKLSFVKILDGGIYDGYDAIVDGSYSQQYGGKDIGSYSLYILKKGKVINVMSWFNEKDIELLSQQDNLKAEDLIETYNFAK